MSAKAILALLAARVLAVSAPMPPAPPVMQYDAAMILRKGDDIGRQALLIRIVLGWSALYRAVLAKHSAGPPFAVAGAL